MHFPEEISTNSDEMVFFSCCKNGRLANLGEKIEDYPEELKVLYSDNHPAHKNFITNIRNYNGAFAWLL